MSDVRLTFRCSEGLADSIDEFGRAHGLERSAAIRELISRALIANANGAADGFGQMFRRELNNYFSANSRKFESMRTVMAATFYLQLLDTWETHDDTSMEDWRAHALAAANGILAGDALDDPEV